MKRVNGWILIGLILVSGPLVACLWDYDTLAMERKRFPGTLELITGKFLRHSKEFYQWRIADRTRRLETASSNADQEQVLKWYDDLAVAYDKTGQHEQAIATILKKEQLSPGRYETQANLGTFYVHSGQFQLGLTHIEQALKINPDAHFGRERYQKLLVEYVLRQRKAGVQGLPLAKPIEDKRFDEFVFKSLGIEDHKQRPHETERAVKGVLGMMRFGHFDSPVLLEALGDLISGGFRPGSDAKRMAARAYLKASYHVADAKSKEAYRKRAGIALRMQTIGKNSTKALTLEALEASLRREMAEADAWYGKVAEDESKWIAAGVNVDEAFSRKYFDTKPAIGSTTNDNRANRNRRLRRNLLIGLGVFLGIAGAGLVFAFRRRRSLGGLAK